jgi:LCP family protein required for cell wall assembly
MPVELRIHGPRPVLSLPQPRQFAADGSPSVKALAARPRRRWRRLVLVGLAAFVALCLLLAGSGYLYLRWRFGQINKIAVPPKTLTPDAPGQVMNVLLVGSDSRADIGPADAGALCKRADCSDQAGAQRSDTIMVLHVDPKAKRAAILSIPRDLWVALPGTGEQNRINTAFGRGVPFLIETVTKTLGIQINHYAQVDFVGFKSLVQTVGGVDIYVPAPARDLGSRLSIPKPGCVTLSGDTALAWVRSRDYEYLEANRWRAEGGIPDFNRIRRQQDFIRRVMKKAIAGGLSNPIKLDRIIGVGIRNLQIDETMSRKDIVQLARSFRSLDPGAVDMQRLPTVAFTGPHGEAAQRLAPDAQSYIDRINGKPPAPAPTIGPSDVRARVLNGTGADGLAGQVSTALEEKRFIVADRGDADHYGYARTVIHYGGGQRAKAQLLQRQLEAGAVLEEDPTLRVVDVVLIVGADYAGVRSAPATNPTPVTTVPAPEPPVPIPKGAPPAQSC